jgi:hypothetical protein
MHARPFRVVPRALAIPAGAAALLSALSERALALPPTVLKVEWNLPGHGYALVAVHGPLQGVMRPGHNDVVVAQPNVIWTNQIHMFTSPTPLGAPMTLTVEDLGDTQLRSARGGRSMGTVRCWGAGPPAAARRPGHVLWIHRRRAEPHRPYPSAL